MGKGAGILVVEFKVLKCGWVVGRLWSVFCGRLQDLGISLFGELVPEFNYFISFKFSIF